MYVQCIIVLICFLLLVICFQKTLNYIISIRFTFSNYQFSDLNKIYIFLSSNLYLYAEYLLLVFSGMHCSAQRHEKAAHTCSLGAAPPDKSGLWAQLMLMCLEVLRFTSTRPE